MSAATVKTPVLPSWQRYSKLFLRADGQSVLRALEYEQLEGLPFNGKILDFGGGAKPKYRDRMDQWAKGCVIESVNINPAVHPTHLVEPGQKLPLDEGGFDMAVTLNTLEHIYDVYGALSELHRILKTGGQLIAAVPFMFRIHGHPDDFLRATPSWWGRTLSLAGFGAIVITPLFWGPFSTGLSVSGTPGPFKKLRLHLALIKDILYAKASMKRFGWTPDTCAPLGFLITAVKAELSSA